MQNYREGSHSRKCAKHVRNIPCRKCQAIFLYSNAPHGYHFGSGNTHWPCVTWALDARGGDHGLSSERENELTKRHYIHIKQVNFEWSKFGSWFDDAECRHYYRTEASMASAPVSRDAAFGYTSTLKETTFLNRSNVRDLLAVKRLALLKTYLLATKSEWKNNVSAPV